MNGLDFNEYRTIQLGNLTSNGHATYLNQPDKPHFARLEAG